MNKQSFTPGPWYTKSARTLIHIKGECGQQIARVSIDRESDACLIASAPNLLKSLQIALSIIEKTASEMNLGYRVTKEGQFLFDSITSCRAALAKAKGE